MTRFEDFGLSENVLEAIRKMGFVEPTPIQKKALPLILEGRDLLGQAQTGTGKTAAFGIPIADKLPVDSRQPEALVLCPTRELAVQVAEEIHEICLFTGHKVLPIYGGQRIDRQITALKKGVQVVVGTPGRILDHLGRGTLKLNEVGLLVLDEADMMLDMGFLPDIRRIIRQTPSERQTLLFSATIPLEIQRISRDYMRDPEFVSVVPETLTVQETEQIFYEVPEDEKIDALMRLLDYEEEGGTAMIFCRTKRNVDKLTRKLKGRGYDVEGLHGDLTQQQRDRIMAGFREGQFAYLIATDVAARGLDISHVTHVVNYHIPQDPEAYVHRIGRTGRMGRAGVAITFVTPAEYWDLLRIQEFSMAQIEPGELPSESEVEERRRAARGDGAARRRVQAADLAGRPGVEAAAGAGNGEPVALVASEAGPKEARSAAAARVPQVETGEEIPAPGTPPEPRPKKPRAPRKRREAEPFVALPELAAEPTTEAERHQRRYTMRDSQKRIEWTEAEEAIREAARIEKEQLVASVHEQALEGSEASRQEEQELEAARAELEKEKTARDAARRADLSERLREAERLAAEEAERRVEGIEGEAVRLPREARAEAARSERAGAEKAGDLVPPVEVSAAAEAVAAETAEEVAEEAPAKRRRPRRKKAAAEETLAPAGERASLAGDEGAVLTPAEEERIGRALDLRDRVLSLVAGLSAEDLDDFAAVVDRVTLDYDLRSVTAALLKELTGGEERPLALRLPGDLEEVETPTAGAVSDGAMTRLFISIGRRARVSKEGLQKLVRETAGIDESDIGRVELLHNFAFVEVRKSVASQVIEKMHESMFRGREISVERAKSPGKEASEEEPEVAGA